MKKLLVVLMVLAFVAPAMAADNLSLSGQIRVRTWDFENFGDFDDNANSPISGYGGRTGFKSSGNTGRDKSELVEQRFRLQTVYKANDNVKGVLRMDFAEDFWGSSNWEGARYGSGSEIQVDRAYLDINAGPVNVKAGQQFMSVGQGQVYRPNKPGVQITLKTPVVVELGYMVEGDQDAGKSSDEQNIHLSVAYKTDAFSVEGFYAQQKESVTISAADDQEDTRMVYGVNAKTSVGPVKLNAELALFGGDNDLTGASARDYVGTQFNVDADMKISDMFKIGADFIYSSGTDDADETKIAYVSDVFGRLNRAEGGSGNNIYAGDLAPLGGDDVFDPFNLNQGAIGLGVDAVITPISGLELLAHVLYLSAAEDLDTGYDSALVYNLGVSYMLVPKAKIGLYYTAVVPDFESASQEDDTASNIGGLLQISF